MHDSSPHPSLVPRTPTAPLDGCTAAFALQDQRNRDRFAAALAVVQRPPFAALPRDVRRALLFHVVGPVGDLGEDSLELPAADLVPAGLAAFEATVEEAALRLARQRNHVFSRWDVPTPFRYLAGSAGLSVWDPSPKARPWADLTDTEKAAHVRALLPPGSPAERHHDVQRQALHRAEYAYQHGDVVADLLWPLPEGQP